MWRSSKLFGFMDDKVRNRSVALFGSDGVTFFEMLLGALAIRGSKIFGSLVANQGCSDRSCYAAGLHGRRLATGEFQQHENLPRLTMLRPTTMHLASTSSPKTPCATPARSSRPRHPIYRDSNLPSPSNPLPATSQRPRPHRLTSILLRLHPHTIPSSFRHTKVSPYSSSSSSSSPQSELNVLSNLCLRPRSCSSYARRQTRHWPPIGTLRVRIWLHRLAARRGNLSQSLRRQPQVE